MQIGAIMNKKITLALLTFTLIAAMLTGCGNSNKLADVFDKDTVEEQAIADITLAESNDFAGWVARFAPEFQSALTEEIYAAYIDTLNQYGTFKEFGQCAIIGQEQNGKNYAIVIIICKHENGDIKYTLAFDEQMNLIQMTI